MLNLVYPARFPIYHVVIKYRLKIERLLKVEVYIGLLSCIVLFTFIALAALLNIQDIVRVILVISGFILFLIDCFIALRIEQVAGYYVCKTCGYSYVPTYKDVNMAMHVGRTRFLKCPKCNSKSWHKKALTKEGK